MNLTLSRLCAIFLCFGLIACATNDGADDTTAAEMSVKQEARLITSAPENPTAPEANPAPDGTAGNYLASRAALQSGDFGQAARFLNETLARDPENPALIERAAVLLLLSGEIDQALPLCQKWANNKPQSLLPNLVRFLAAAKHENWAEARSAANQLTVVKTNQLTVPLLLAWLDVAESGLDAALIRLQPILAHPTAGGIVLLHAALMSEYARDFERAQEFYTLANARFSVLPLRLVINTGQLLERRGEFDAALGLYQAFVQRSPNNYVLDNAIARVQTRGLTAPANIRTLQDGIAQVLFDLATSFEGQQSNELALIYARLATYMQPDFAFNRLLTAELYEDYEQYDKAAAIYDSLRDHPDFGWTAALRLARNWDKLEQDQKAIALLEGMRKSQPSRSEPIIMLGDLYRSAKDFAAAIEAYSEAIALVPEPYAAKDWPLFYARGVAFEQAKLWPSAEKDFQTALRLSPDQPYVLNYLAYSWVEQRKNLPEALAMLQRAVALAPEDAFIIDSLGWAYYMSGQYAEALTYLQRAVQIRPFDPQLLDHYGDALWQTGAREQARQQWQRALGFDPGAELGPKLTEKMQHGLGAKVETTAPSTDATPPVN